MTYALFLALFLLPLVVLGIIVVRPVFGVRHLLFLGGLSLVVLAWTTPWDNASVAMGLWGFDAERTSGLVLGLLPIEEYSFFLLQTWVTALLLIRWLMR